MLPYVGSVLLAVLVVFLNQIATNRQERRRFMREERTRLYYQYSDLVSKVLDNFYGGVGTRGELSNLIVELVRVSEALEIVAPMGTRNATTALQSALANTYRFSGEEVEDEARQLALSVGQKRINEARVNWMMHVRSDLNIDNRVVLRIARWRHPLTELKA
jgi:hypothetical protein